MKIYHLLMISFLICGCQKRKSKSSESEILDLVINAVESRDSSGLHDFTIGKGSEDTKRFDMVLSFAYGSTLNYYEFLKVSEAVYKYPGMVEWSEEIDSDDKILHIKWNKNSEFGTRMDIDQFFIIGFDDGSYNIKIPGR